MDAVTRTLLDYVGAGARIDRDRGLELDPRRWAWQPKVDGVYARISLDQRGRVSNVLSRAGRPLAEARDLLGIVAGAPDSVLHGELEAHTEAGNRAALRGWRCVHVFDVTRANGRDVSAAPYTQRYGVLHEMQAAIELDGRARVRSWTVDAGGAAHSATTGRFVRAIPRDLRRFPIVPLARGFGAGEQLWLEHVERGGGEGLVAVRLDAAAGARGGKRKIKATDTLDVVVIASDGRAAIVGFAGHTFAVASSGAMYAAGEVLEVAHDGWYENATVPRFARVVRRRLDLASAPARAH